MECCSVHSIAVQNGIDPTRTTSLRNLFARQMRKRFDELTKTIKTTVDTQDCFGLKPGAIQTHQMETPGHAAFAFVSDAKKIEEFMAWLRLQVEKGLLELRVYQQIGAAIENAWTNIYIYDSYKRGVQRARYEMIRAGYDVPPLSETGGIEAVMGNPFHVDRVGVLYVRAFDSLRGITESMSDIIGKILAQGMIDGDGPALLARKMVAAINGTGLGELGLRDKLGRFIPAKRRAEILARTEIIRAHHLATIQEYRNWQVLNIKVLAEWSTAGDDRVCPICAGLEGKIYTLDEIEPMIPMHPQCRCIALPYIADLQKYK